MLKVRPFLLACAHLLAAGVAFAQNSYVFQLPGQTGTANQILAKGDDDFSRSLTATSPAKAYGVVATPTGSKFYVLAPAGIYSAAATPSGGAFAQPTLANPTLLGGALAGAISDAKVTPDGKYLLLITSHFYIVDTATDHVAADTDIGVPAGQLPVSVAVSHDGKTAWVLSNGHSQSTVMAVSLTNFQVTGQLTLPAAGSSITLSPRNLLYVSAFGQTIFEIDPSSLALTASGTIQISDSHQTPGVLQFTSDGNTAFFLNTQLCGVCAPVLKLDVPSHAVFSWMPADGTTPPVIDQILVAGSNQAFVFSSASTKLWTITPTPLTLTQSVFSGVPTGDVRTVAISNERPSAHYLYLSDGALDMFRVNLSTNQIDKTSTLDPFQYKVLTFVPIPARTGGTTLSQVNPVQNVTAASNAVLIGQILDSAGHPVFGAPVTFSTQVTNSCAGAVITSPSVTTAAEGFAQTVVTAPAVAGTCIVTMHLGSLSVDFQLLVGAGSGKGGAPTISIYTGDGQLLRQNQTTLETRQPMTVIIRDANGAPIQGVAVGFAVEGSDIGTVNSSSATTDSNGKAWTDFTTGSLDGLPFALSRVMATSVYGSVEFYMTTQDAKINDLHAPQVNMVSPANQQLTIQEGAFVPAALSAQTISEKTAGPIPNVGLRLADFSNPVVNSSVISCVGRSRGDANGISRCNVQAACQPTITLPASFNAILEVGEYQYFQLQINVIQANPSLLIAVPSSDNQSGNPGDTLTLKATVADGCQHPATNFGGLSWTVLTGSPGSASISTAQTTSDFLGQVSAKVILGQTAGLVRVQLSGPGLPPILFNLTTKTSISGISLVSGDKQSAVIGQAFTNPVVFVVRDGNNNPAAGLTVSFSATGGATVNPASATTNAQGQVQTVVTAGSTTGNIVVTAASGTLTQTATLSAHVKGPSITSSSFTNAASGIAGMTPCGLVTVTGDGLAPTVQGVVSAATFFGAMPLSMAGLSITANSIPVPLQSVSNQNGVQSATFQAPCELTAGFATVVITVNGVSSSPVSVSVLDGQPGIFTSPGPNGKQYAAVIRKVDGTYVTPSNPARLGEVCYVVVTGLGQTTSAATTNSVGVGSQTVNVPVGVILSGAGLPALSARYLFGSVGSYLIEFQIPTGSAVGPDQSLVVVTTASNGDFISVSNTVPMAGVIAVP